MDPRTILNIGEITGRWSRRSRISLAPWGLVRGAIIATSLAIFPEIVRVHKTGKEKEKVSPLRVLERENKRETGRVTENPNTDLTPHPRVKERAQSPDVGSVERITIFPTVPKTRTGKGMVRVEAYGLSEISYQTNGAAVIIIVKEVRRKAYL